MERFGRSNTRKIEDDLDITKMDDDLVNHDMQDLTSNTEQHLQHKSTPNISNNIFNNSDKMVFKEDDEEKYNSSNLKTKRDQTPRFSKKQTKKKKCIKNCHIMCFKSDIRLQS
jgi:hypothetical protein